MRFLCLHGSGTNSQILETQTAALRYELGDHHTYDFVEGTIPSAVAPEFDGLVSSKDEFFSYLDLDDRANYLSILEDLDNYISEEGPFDAVLAFSEGAMIAATYIIWKAKQTPKQQRMAPIFKCAVFFSAWDAYDPDLLSEGVLRPLNPSADRDLIRMPTAHIWGVGDASSTKASNVSEICVSETRQVYVHPGSHEIPGARMSSAVKSSVRIIRRVISLVREIDNQALRMVERKN
ncbi:serine hydrolase FSH [Daldinia caldariorum]|uniref:serine hydrolase FSH n=1 Tax=Daldinia caldariorum TaxID=326644 RepID=UPI00200816ED|nr:serine hydrolase FSH [Daldinia caldariorum]KAI1464032.1 serine hydrolase FSH [Daldinia caldariorum]